MPVCPDGHESSTEDWCNFCGIPMQNGRQSAPPAPGETGGAPTQAAPVCTACAAVLPAGAQFCEVCGQNQALPVTAVPPATTGGWGGPPPPPPAPEPVPFPFPDPEPQLPVDPVAPYPSSASGPSTPSVSTGSVPSHPAEPPAEDDWSLTPPASHATGTWLAVVTADRDYFQQMMARSGPDAQGLYFPPYCPERRIALRGPQMRIGRRSAKTGSIPEIDLATSPEDPGVSHTHAVLDELPDGSWTVTDKKATNGTTLNGSPDPLLAEQPVPLKNGDRIHVGAWTTITVHLL